MENTGDTYRGHGAAARGPAPRHYIRASAHREHGVTTVRDLLPGPGGMGAPGVCATVPCLAAGTSEPKKQHLGPPQGQGPWDPARGEQKPPRHRCPKAIPKSCPKEGSGDDLPLPGITQSRNSLFLAPLPACTQGKGAEGHGGSVLLCRKSPEHPRHLPHCAGCPWSRGSMLFHPSGQGEPRILPRTGSLHDTSKTLMVGDLLFVVEVSTCLRRRCPAPAGCGDLGGPHCGHPGGSAGLHKPYEGFINPKDL